jgi:hypothetical protein
MDKLLSGLNALDTDVENRWSQVAEAELGKIGALILEAVAEKAGKTSVMDDQQLILKRVQGRDSKSGASDVVHLRHAQQRIAGYWDSGPGRERVRSMDSDSVIDLGTITQARRKKT